jgi:uncharacterized protein (DUF58 family)
MISKEIFAKVRKLEIRTKGLVNTLFGGEYNSAFKGRGMTFSEVRTYQYGDDIRQIDWNVTARTGDPYVKIFEEEREQTLMLMVDISPSGQFGSKDQRKIDVATELAAVLAFSAIKNNDKVGLVLFTDKIEKVVYPRKGRLHVLRLIRELFYTTPQSTGTNITEALKFTNRILNRRSIVVMISDFQDKDFDKQLKITHRKHDLVSINIYDPLEYELPNLGITPYFDPETGKVIYVDTSSKETVLAFKARKLKQIDLLKSQFTKMGIDMIQIQTSKSYIEPLMNFFKRRAKRY